MAARRARPGQDDEDEVNVQARLLRNTGMCGQRDPTLFSCFVLDQGHINPA